MSVKRRIEEIPQSSESIRRKIMGSIHAVERESDLFLSRYLSSIGEPERWYSVIKSVCGHYGKNADQMDDFKDLGHLLQKYRSDSNAKQYSEIAQLRRMVERGQMFEYIAFSLRNDLVAAYDLNLKKYCLSFQPEALGRDVQSVRDYENKTIHWRTDIEQRLDAVDTLLDDVDNYKSPLSQYITNYRRVLTLMEDTCKSMVRSCEPMKKWVTSDASYARRVQEEINIYNKRKMELRDVVRTLENERDQIGLRLRRRAFFVFKIEKMIKDVTDDKRFYKRRELEIKDHQEKSEAELARKRRDMDEVKSKFTNRKDNSPSVYNYLSALIEALRSDIWKLEEKVDLMQKQINGHRKKQAEIQKELDKLYIEVEASNTIRDKTLAKLDKSEYDLKLIKQELGTLDGKVEVLKRIRELKLHSDTVKKIYHFGYNPGNSEIILDLDAAIKIAAKDMGKDWVWLYRKLPFKPPRDTTVRNMDIEVIDRNSRRLPKDTNYSFLAEKSMEKWKRLSTVASLPELIATLKQMKYKDTITRIQGELRSKTT